MRKQWMGFAVLVSLCSAANAQDDWFVAARTGRGYGADTLSQGTVSTGYWLNRSVALEAGYWRGTDWSARFDDGSRWSTHEDGLTLGLMAVMPLSAKWDLELRAGVINSERDVRSMFNGQTSRLGSRRALDPYYSIGVSTPLTDKLRLSIHYDDYETGHASDGTLSAGFRY